jgi:hypothetical protein
MRWHPGYVTRHDVGVLTTTEAREMLLRLAAAATRGSAAQRAAAISELEHLEGRDIVRLDDNARVVGWSGAAPVSGTTAWRDVDLGEESRLVAAIGSMHADGRLRERAVMVLAGRPGRLHAALLAVRCVDHVPQVRQAAQLGLAAHSEVVEAWVVLPVLLAVCGRVAASDALIGYENALLARHGDGVVRDLRASTDRATRRWALGRCLARDLLSVDDLAAAARAEHDQLARGWCAERLAATADPVVVRALLANRHVEGRLAALTHLPDEHLSETDVEAALLDRSARVREVAQWRARRRGIDPLVVYRDALKAPQPPRRTAACLAGLAGLGDRGDAATVEPLLRDLSPSVRAAAIRALAALHDAASMPTSVPPMLLDDSPQVATAAADALTSAPARTVASVLNAAWRSDQVWSRRAAWRLQRNRGRWDRVEADLRAATDDDETLASLGRAGLSNWLTYNAATTWARPSAEQAARVAELLDLQRVAEETTRLVAFHAAIPRRDRPSSTSRSTRPTAWRIEASEPRTFRCTASVGWRTAGWPFGRLEVCDESLRIRSWHWSWWLPARDVPREHIDALELRVLSGAATLRLRPHATADIEPGTITVAIFPTRLLGDLLRRGYAVEPRNRAARRMLTRLHDRKASLRTGQGQPSRTERVRSARNRRSST